MLSLEATSTALVVIDLQTMVTSTERAPHSASSVIEECKRLAAMFRAAKAPVVQVRVGFAEDWCDLPPQNVDQPTLAALGKVPKEAFEFVAGVLQPGDLVVTKKQWGAFTGTDLDVQLRRRGIRTVVVVGVATNFGVESTVRHGWELGYDLVVVEDACTTASKELHDLAITKIFPRIARVVSGSDLALTT